LIKTLQWQAKQEIINNELMRRQKYFAIRALRLLQHVIEFVHPAVELSESALKGRKANQKPQMEQNTKGGSRKNSHKFQHYVAFICAHMKAF